MQVQHPWGRPRAGRGVQRVRIGPRQILPGRGEPDDEPTGVGRQHLGCAGIAPILHSAPQPRRVRGTDEQCAVDRSPQVIQVIEGGFHRLRAETVTIDNQARAVVRRKLRPPLADTFDERGGGGSVDQIRESARQERVLHATMAVSPLYINSTESVATGSISPAPVVPATTRIFRSHAPVRSSSARTKLTRAAMPVVDSRPT